MGVFKLSIVIPGRREISGIQNIEKEPKLGDILTIGTEKFEIVEVAPLIPPRENFAYYHVICMPVDENAQTPAS
jgi:hypothetical protein